MFDVIRSVCNMEVYGSKDKPKGLKPDSEIKALLGDIIKRHVSRNKGYTAENAG